jgi:hypothetical protein
MRRRKKGTGSVYQRKDGVWIAQFEGKYRYAKAEKDVRRKLRLLLQQTDTAVKPTNLTVVTALDECLVSARRSLEPRTVTRNEVATESASLLGQRT